MGHFSIDSLDHFSLDKNISKIRFDLGSDKALKYLAPREVMEAMETIVRITCIDKPWSIYSEIGPLQQKIVDLFEIATET